MRVRRGLLPLAVFTVIIVGAPSVLAVSTSENFELSESQFGVSSSLEGCSDRFCARVSMGDVAVGGSESASTTAEFGSITDEMPALEMITEPGESRGDLSPNATATRTVNLKVRNHMSGGYVVMLTGASPGFKDHAIETPEEPVASTPGIEQFAVNVVANSTPRVGSDPRPQGGTTGDTRALVMPDYRIPDAYRYLSGDTIIRNISESSRTDYTISMIINISSITPAGDYSGSYQAIIAPAY